MDKEEFNSKLDEINSLVDNKDYETAMEIVDSIEWKRVKNIRMLCTVGEIYATNKRYEDSRDIFLLAYNRSSVGKTILYRLVEVSLKLNNIKEAEEYYDEFVNTVPHDNTRYILKYKIESAKNAPIEDLIAILEEYKDREFTERWSYELAKLYDKAGDKDKCIDVCDDMFVWFRDGKYVFRALDLKKKYTALTPAQQEVYNNFQKMPPKKEELELSQKIEEDEPEEVKIPAAEESVGETADQPQPISNTENEKFQEQLSNEFNDIIKSANHNSDQMSDQEIDELSEQIEGQISLSDILPEMTSEPKENVSALESEKDSQEFSNVDMSDVAIEKPVRQEDTAQTDSFSIDMEANILAAAKAQGIIPSGDEKSERKAAVPDQMSEEAKEAGNGQNTQEEAQETRETEEAQETIETEETAKTAETTEEKTIDFEEEISLDKQEETESLSEEDELLNFIGEINKEIDDENKEENPVEAQEQEETETETETETESESESEPLSEEDELLNFIDEINRDPNIEEEDIVPRENELSDEEEKIFKYFTSIPGMKEQIVETLKDVQNAAANKTSVTGNVIIMGNKGSGKSTLVNLLVRAICNELHLPAAKIASIEAEKLNQQNVAQIIDKLSGGFLLITDANHLNEETIEALNQALEFRTDGLTVFIEDEKIGMRKFIAKNPKLNEKFTSTISIPVFTNDELINFAKFYTNEIGYKIDEMAVLALYTLISNNQKEDEPMTINGVKVLVDDAIAKSESGVRKLQRNFAKSRTDKEGYTLLYEKDFK